MSERREDGPKIDTVREVMEDRDEEIETAEDTVPEEDGSEEDEGGEG